MAGWKMAVSAIQCIGHGMVAVVTASVDLHNQKLKPTRITLGATKSSWMKRSLIKKP